MSSQQGVAQRNALEDMAATLGAIPGSLIEVSFADAGGSRINRAIYHQGITGENLLRYADRKDASVFFLNGLDQSKGNFALNTEVSRSSKDEMVTARNIISLDADFKDFVPGFELLSPTEKAAIIQGKFFEFHSKLKGRFGDVWMAVVSGNGLHLHFKLKTPLNCEDKRAYTAGYQHLIQRLEGEVFGGEIQFDRACSNTARVFRLPFSTNLKDQKAPAPVGLIYHNPEANSSLVISELWKAAEEWNTGLESMWKAPERASFSASHKDQLRDALTFPRILEHFGYQKFQSMKQLPSGEVLCSSPWDRDSNPSCYLNEQKKAFKDFSTGKGGDILTFIAELANKNIKTDFPSVIKEAEKITGISPLARHPGSRPSLAVSNGQPDEATPEREIKRKATYSDYVPFFKEHLGETRRDIFSGALMYRSEEKRWLPAVSALRVLGAKARDTGYLQSGVALEEYLALFADSHPKELLIDIPEWDGVDRIHDLSLCMTIRNCSQQHFEALLKDWGAKMFQRIHNPRVQNRMLIFRSEVQGLGKDDLIHALLGGLETLLVEPSFSRNDTDNFITLADNLVINITEIDKIHSTIGPGTLKAWITQPSATFRRPYEKMAYRHDLRCSFIATSNADSLLKDYTGNRRYLVFDIVGLSWNYPTDQSLQFLAQFKKLASENFKASPEAEAAMKQYIEEHTPEDPKTLVLEDFDNKMRVFEQHHPHEKGRFSLELIREALVDLARVHGMPLKGLQTLLKTNGRSSRSGPGYRYFRKASS